MFCEQNGTAARRLNHAYRCIGRALLRQPENFMIAADEFACQLHSYFYRNACTSPVFTGGFRDAPLASYSHTIFTLKPVTIRRLRFASFTFSQLLVRNAQFATYWACALTLKRNIARGTRVLLAMMFRPGGFTYDFARAPSYLAFSNACAKRRLEDILAPR